MFTIVAVVRRNPGLSVEEFRRAWKGDYGPLYRRIPQVRSYEQHHLDDRRKDAAEDPIDGIAILTFDSEEAMREAWKSDAYKEATAIRERIMRETAVGVHVAAIHETVRIV